MTFIKDYEDPEAVSGKEKATIRLACESNLVNGVSMYLHAQLSKNVDAFKDTMQGADGSTLLMIACDNGHADMVCVLVLLLKKLGHVANEHQRWISEYLGAQDRYGLTAIHICSLRGHVTCISALSFLEPSLLRCPNRSGQTAYELSLSSNNADSIQYFDTFINLQDTSRRSVTSRKKPFSLPAWFKTALSKRSLIYLYQVAPYYAYITSLAVCFCFSLHFLRHSCANETSSISSCHFPVHCINIVLQMLVWVVTALVMNTNPGTIVEHDGRSYLLALLRIQEQSVRNKFTSSSGYCCHLCRCYRPLRCGHSRVAGRCLPKFDHFCNFLWSDIARDNYFYFYLFLWMMATALPLIVFLCADHLVYQLEGEFYFKEYSQDTATQFVLWMLKTFTVWCLLVWITCVCLLMYHTRMSTLNLTTREYLLGAQKFPYLNREALISHCANPSLGVLAGYSLNCVDKFFPVSGDDCWEESDLADLQERALARVVEWRAMFSVFGFLRRCCCWWVCGWAGKREGSGDARYSV